MHQNNYNNQNKNRFSMFDRLPCTISNSTVVYSVQKIFLNVVDRKQLEEFEQRYRVNTLYLGKSAIVEYIWPKINSLPSLSIFFKNVFYFFFFLWK